MGGRRRRTIGEEEQDIAAMSDEERDYNWRESQDSYYYPKSSRDVSCGSSDSMLPSVSTKIRSRKESGHLYRIPNRIMRWICLALMATILLFILNLTRMGMNSAKTLEMLKKARPLPPPPTWESFPFLNRYFGGIRTLVPRSKNLREYPTENITLVENRKEVREVPESQAYNIFSEYRSRNSEAVECFMDLKDSIRIPSVHNYKGIPKGMPESAMGSSSVLGISEEYCFDRYGKLGPYGFGYSSTKGGIGAGIEGEREGADNVWSDRSAIDYTKVRWHDIQQRCLEKNKHRFTTLKATTGEKWQEMPWKRDKLHQNTTHSSIPRTAFILRTWTGFDYTPEVMLFLRSLISEIALTSAGEYTVHFLVHVKNDNEPIWADSDTYDRVLHNALPQEFRGMATLWSERQMNLIYGGLPDSFHQGRQVHGVYRSAHFPLQYFASKHPEFEYYWNWEMDTRYTGHWLTFFEKARAFAKAQPRKGLWERNARFYVPEVHGSWEDFKQMVRVQSEMPVQPVKSKWAHTGPPGSVQVSDEVEKPIWGRKAPLTGFAKFATDPEPPTTYEKDKYSWGVGEEADLITFNPIFDPAQTDWILKDDLTSYDTTKGMPPRRTAVVASSRLSRRLLMTMHNETTFHGHTMFTEMFPPTMALHHGLKAVYAPNPVYIDRAWPLPYLAQTMNAGKNGAVGGARTSVFGTAMQHNLRGVTWHYNDGFAPNLWKRWLGYRVNNDGGEEYEMNHEGRMCLPPILLHPVKDVQLVIEDLKGEEQT